MNSINSTNPKNSTNSINSNAHDPQAIAEARELQTDIQYFEDPYKAAKHAEALLILTGWPEYNDLDYSRVKEQMTSANLIDGRNMLDARKLQNLGFKYEGMGRN